MTKYSIYIHYPFCIRRCGYCDFNTYAGLLYSSPEYIHSLCKEIQWIGERENPDQLVHTIYFGGGTPSLIPIKGIDYILNTINNYFNIDPEAEITIEANPGTVSYPYLQGIVKSGINRISFGFQSANPLELQLLDRRHDFFDVSRAYTWSRRAGIKNINFDLIYGLPEQTLLSWEKSLNFAMNFNPEHLSLYSLTIEPETRLSLWYKKGLIQPVDDDLAADMYELACEFLEKKGFQQYEISNWAKEYSTGNTFACKHNLQYWRNLPYFGFGAGAHGFINNIRFENVSSIPQYIEKCNQNTKTEYPIGPANSRYQVINPHDEMEETMMMGLRLTREGVSKKIFFQRFNNHLEDVYGRKIDRLFKSGLLEYQNLDNDRIRLTKRGRLLGNQVFLEFIGN